MKTIWKWAAMTATMVLVQPAVAQQVERHEKLALAQAVDEKCGFLPYLEHKTLINIAWKAMESSSFYSSSQKMGDKNLLSKFYRQQDAKAAGMTCTPETAQAIIVPFRNETVNELAIAVASIEVKKQLSQPNTNSIYGMVTISPPSEDDVRAAQQLAGYVQQLWGANAPTNWKWAMGVAESRVRAKPDDSDLGQILYMVDYQARAERDKRMLVGAPRPWQRLRDTQGKTDLTQRRGVFGGFGSAFLYLVVRDGQVMASMHKMNADDMPGLTGMRIYIRKPDAPTQKNSLPLTWDATWRTQAQVFDMVATGDTAYGGKLYKAPPAAIAALKALNEEDEIEIAPIIGGDDQKAGSGSGRPTFKIAGIKTVLP